ncbi:hypothetical protein ACJMK2_011829 [Sinanodonta woodiana]|uniref:Uncharacterized protein n=1 Tax=Sinanodonta woodiana TaxID=1069815 RepID=A0ABD3V698_SINWO
MTLSTSAFSTEVSLKMNRVIDSVGLAEDIRLKKINMRIQSEEVIFLSLYSSGGGNYDPGLNSDVDNVACLNTIAVQDFQNWVPRYINILVVSDKNTPPGIVKLQDIYDDQPLPVYNEDGCL